MLLQAAERLRESVAQTQERDRETGLCVCGLKGRVPDNPGVYFSSPRTSLRDSQLTTGMTYLNP